jgi:hypothetical protein
MTMRAFLEAYPVTLEILDGPDYQRDAEQWEHNAYRVELRHEARTMVSPWRQGILCVGDPTVERVLDSIASDCASVENARDFADWCDEVGYDTDSRKAEATYYECREQARKLRAMLGDKAAKELLWEVERQ